MRRQFPIFFRVPGVGDAAAEFHAMLVEVGEQGAHLLAEFAELQKFKKSTDVPNQDRSATAGLFIRYLGDWAVFYTAHSRPFVITLVHIARYRRDGATVAGWFRAAAREASARMLKS